MDSDRTLAESAALASADGALDLLVLFGSRARGDFGPGSDWDFAFLAGEGFDREALRARLEQRLAPDRVDLVDLSHSGGLLRYRVCRDGRPLFSRTGAWERFWFDAVSFWCDQAPNLRAGYSEILESLP